MGELHLHSALSSPYMDSKAFYTTVIHTLVVVSYVVATAGVGRTDRGEAAPGPSDQHQ